MKKVQLRFISIAAVLIAMVLLCPGSASAASMLYLVTVDTSSVSGTTGFLDFQFNPTQSDSQLAEALIINFNTGGGALVFNGNSPQVSGDVTGTLPNSVTMVNDTSFNEVLQQFVYGGFFSFQLYLTGPALDAPNGTSTGGSAFGLALLDQNQNGILAGGNDFAGQADINLDGSVTTQSFPATGSVVTFQVLPEPGSLGLLALGAASLLVVRKLRAVAARRFAGSKA